MKFGKVDSSFGLAHLNLNAQIFLISTLYDLFPFQRDFLVEKILLNAILRN
jgi:hypothetical protein